MANNSLQFNDLVLEWLGHASFRIKWDGKIIYLDPYQVFSGPPADLIFITHEHYDHCDPESVKSLLKSETFIITTHLAASKLPFPNVKIVHPNAAATEQGIHFKTIPAYCIDKPYHPQGEERVGFILSLNNITIYHAGDTDLVPEMSQLGPVDIALLPIGGKYTMDAPAAAKAVKIIKPKIVIPMHYGTLPDLVGNPREFQELVGNITKVEILE